MIKTDDTDWKRNFFTADGRGLGTINETVEPFSALDISAKRKKISGGRVSSGSGSLQKSLRLVTVFFWMAASGAGCWAIANAGIMQDKAAGEAPAVLQFPPAQYKDFALAANSSRLTAKEPNVHVIGPPGSPPDAQVLQDKDGYSEVNLPYMGLQLNVPFGWASWGGFNAMARIDFFPDPEHKSNANLIASPITLGIKVLNLGGTSFQNVLKNVLKKVQSFSGEGGKVAIETDEAHHAFLIKVEKINNPNSKDEDGLYGLYLQDPTPGSMVWVCVVLRAPQSDFKKYTGLMGLVYRDMKVNWPALEDYIRRHPGE